MEVDVKPPKVKVDGCYNLKGDVDGKRGINFPSLVELGK